jgi:hypothetical protein
MVTSYGTDRHRSGIVTAGPVHLFLQASSPNYDGQVSHGQPGAHVLSSAPRPVAAGRARPVPPSQPRGRLLVTVEDCLLRARRCLREADLSEDDPAFVAWIELAAAWVELAKQPEGAHGEEVARLEAEEADLQRMVDS